MRKGDKDVIKELKDMVKDISINKNQTTGFSQNELNEMQSINESITILKETPKVK